MHILETDIDIFQLPKTTEAVCVTTNGVVDKNGNAVSYRWLVAVVVV